MGTNTSKESLEEETQPKSDLEAIRDKNIRERDAFFANQMKENPELAEAIEALELLQPSPGPRPVVSIKRRSKDKDKTFRFTGNIPLERRKSARLENKSPIFDGSELPKGTGSTSWKDCMDNLDDLQEVVYQPKRRRTVNQGQRRRILPVEEVTGEMLDKIAKNGKKEYSHQGSSCHQCRQKTKDTKTCCRNPDCVGVNGQLCEPCIRNRYGEHVATALLDPNWICFVCRGTCNCSNCRGRNGLRPTGILAPYIQKQGYKSVHDYLVERTVFNKSEDDGMSDERNHDNEKRDDKDILTNDSDDNNDSEKENTVIKMKWRVRSKTSDSTNPDKKFLSTKTPEKKTKEIDNACLPLKEWNIERSQMPSDENNLSIKTNCAILDSPETRSIKEQNFDNSVENNSQKKVENNESNGELGVENNSRERNKNVPKLQLVSLDDSMKVLGFDKLGKCKVIKNGKTYEYLTDEFPNFFYEEQVKFSSNVAPNSLSLKIKENEKTQVVNKNHQNKKYEHFQAGRNISLSENEDLIEENTIYTLGFDKLGKCKVLRYNKETGKSYEYLSDTYSIPFKEKHLPLISDVATTQTNTTFCGNQKNMGPVTFDENAMNILGFDKFGKCKIIKSDAEIGKVHEYLTDLYPNSFSERSLALINDITDSLKKEIEKIEKINANKSCPNSECNQETETDRNVTLIKNKKSKGPSTFDEITMNVLGFDEHGKCKIVEYDTGIGKSYEYLTDIFPDSFSEKHLALINDLLKIKTEGCEEILMTLNKHRSLKYIQEVQDGITSTIDKICDNQENEETTVILNYAQPLIKSEKCEEIGINEDSFNENVHMKIEVSELKLEELLDIKKLSDVDIFTKDNA